MIRTLNMLPSISRLAGGLAPAVLESMAVQRGLGVETRIATLHDPFTDADASSYGVPYAAVKGYPPIGISPELKRLVFSQSPRPEILHIHGMWTYCDYLALQAHKRLGIPLVCTPHGMLRRWAFYHRRWKKQPIWWLWEQQKHARAAAVVATSAVEAQEMRDLGLRMPIALIPHGLHLPDPTLPKPANTPRIALFLSRIHPVKGLPLLIAAAAKVRPTGWQFVIAGPGEDGHLEEIQAQVRAAGLEDLFTLPGPVYGAAKWDAYRQADLFVLPTLSENFGIVIAEALACETPVLTTTGAPWQELTTHRCGWWVDANVDAIAGALTEALSQPTEALRAMGQRGRALVQSQYTWEQSTSRLIELYEWILGRCAQPAFVTTA